MYDSCGTPAYIAPEVITSNGYSGFGSDIWSAGVVLFAMVYGAVPFKAADIDELYDLIWEGKFSLKADVSPEVRDLLWRMLERVPSEWIWISEILSHPWLSDVEKDLDLLNEAEKTTIIK